MNSVVEYEFIPNDDKKKLNEVIITFHPLKKNSIFVVEYKNKEFNNINKILTDVIKKNI